MIKKIIQSELTYVNKNENNPHYRRKWIYRVTFN